ncbi:MAG TPA: serine/threonine-protein kinase, partial [Gemmatimonadales bacterium]|nr:serine/threonine-protein kinase [Gemmatimonadales bacterium]
MTIERLTTSLADRYRIERTVGQGGMATVYLAQDLKHHRPVAIKVLKPELAAVIGADRFVQEITTTAQLQHPHILPLFDSGQTDGFLYYVMPYIEGETLRDKLTRETQLAIDESLRITTEVADALDYAHRHGVVHRDIKPENILLHDGRPMVADFGIALALSAAAGGRMTETGMSLGTPHYMSPEQATADKEITGKSDIYSLGTVLYEMLTGSPPHVGSSAQQIVMKILTEDAPPVATLRRSVPPNVAAAVATALEKLPADRFESAQAFARALADPAYHRERLAAGAPPGSARPNRRLTLGLSAALAVVTLLAAWALVRPRPAAAVSRYGLALPPPAAFDPTGYVIITPDGSRIVYTAPAALHGQWQLWMKARERTDPAPIPETEAATAAAISPDGQWLAFVQGDSLRKTPLAGGSAVTLVPSGVSSAGGELVWLADGTLVYAGTGMQRLLRVAAAGGPATTVWTSDSLEAFDLGALTGSHLLVSLCPVPCGRFVNLWAIDLRDHSARQLVAGAGKGYYLGDGRLAFVREDGAVVVMPFDPGALTVRGAAVVVADSVAWGNVV